MRGDTQPHTFDGGLDLHARTRDACILDQPGESTFPRHLHANPEAFFKAIAPYRDALVVAVEGLFTWAWLADLGAREGIPWGLGHALSMNASQGGQAKHDTSEAHQIAGLRRGGRLPQADVDPAARRATRHLGRRRMHLRRQRAA
jgi:Transposase